MEQAVEQKIAAVNYSLHKRRILSYLGSGFGEELETKRGNEKKISRRRFKGKKTQSETKVSGVWLRRKGFLLGPVIKMINNCNN